MITVNDGQPDKQLPASTGWIAVWLDSSPQARFRRFIKRIIHKIRPVNYTFVMPTVRQEFFFPYLEGCGFHDDKDEPS